MGFAKDGIDEDSFNEEGSRFKSIMFQMMQDQQDDAPVKVEWPEFPLAEQSPTKEYTLSQRQVESLAKAYPSYPITSPPWHLIEATFRILGGKTQDVQNLDAIYLLFCADGLNTRHSRRKARTLPPVQGEHTSAIRIYVGTVAHRTYLLMVAMFRELVCPYFGRSRISRLLGLWNVHGQNLRRLREECLTQLDGFEFFEDVRDRLFEIYLTFDYQRIAATKLEAWIADGKFPDGWQPEHIRSINAERNDQTLDWIEERFSDIERWINDGKKPAVRSSPVLVTAKQIGVVVGLSKKGIKPYESMWTLPVIKGEGNRAHLYDFDEIMNIVIQQWPHREHELRELRREIKKETHL